VGDDEMPLFAIVALNQCRLHVWPKSIRLLTNRALAAATAPIKRHTLYMQPGDIVVCRVDLVHAGAAYDAFNLQLHCLLESDHVRRPEKEKRQNWVIHRARDGLARTILK
jgi:hypothetical protein